MYDAVGKVAGFIEAEDELDECKALQALINSGTAWHLEGAVGRAAMNAIEAGLCLCGHAGHSDYYGGYVPSRHELKAGTKGTIEYVRELRGDSWADELAEVE